MPTTPKDERTPIPFNEALRRILNAPPAPKKAPKKKVEKSSK